MMDKPSYVVVNTDQSNNSFVPCAQSQFELRHRVCIRSGMVTPAPPNASLPKRLTTVALSSRLRRLFDRLDRCPGPLSLEALHSELHDAQLTAEDLVPHAASDRAGYVRTLVHFAPHYEALVMCWLPGQHSPVHDHGGSACAVQVVEGHATEIAYHLRSDGLTEPVGTRVYRAGEVVCSKDEDIHSLGNLPVNKQPAGELVTLHIYSPHLIGSRKYLIHAGAPTGASA